uniref:Uncharacterized protein n=1 Tax=Arundo donax TaxID=35708 RepID=A0A0A9A8E9_ARUDO
MEMAVLKQMQET